MKIMRIWSVAGIVYLLLSAPAAQAKGGGENLATSSTPPVVGQKAFPSAQGYGAYAKGGRGGDVLFVTNLNDSGPGSLREAVKATGPRTVIFRVGGLISLETPLNFKHPYITIAGETAPGDGICVRGDKVVVETHDVIVRHFCVRVGSAGGSSPPSKRDAFDIRDAHDVIIDHCSFSWSLDEVFDMTEMRPPVDARNITLQWSIIGEPLYVWDGGKEGSTTEHGFGLLVGGGGGGVTNVSMHHNLLTQAHQRSPNIESGATADFVNNYVFNWGLRATLITTGSNDGKHHYYGPLFVNVINNIYKAGPGAGDGSNLDGRIVVGQKRISSSPPINDSRVYIHGNVDGDGREADAVTDCGGELKFDAQTRVQVLMASPVKDGPFALVPEETERLGDTIFGDVGRTVPSRDAVDVRIIDDVRKGVSRRIKSPDEVGGYPDLKSGTPYPDADQDGMDDDWEKAHDLNPKDPSDGKTDRNGDGYTNLEEFLDQLATGKQTPLGQIDALKGEFPSPPSSVSAAATTVKGGVYVASERLMSDGQPFNLCGVQTLAFVAPKAQLDRHTSEARAQWNQSQLDSIKDFGANLIRFQMSQAGLDERSSIYSESYFNDLTEGVSLALASGFRVILSMQWEKHSGAPVRQRLPAENTVQIWRKLAEQYKDDERVLFELYNEPGALPTPENWQLWLNGGPFGENPDGKAVGMQRLIDTIRATGARNVLILPGLKLEKILTGAPIPVDPLNNIAFGFHTPDLESSNEQWEKQFGFMAARHPVILTEWVAGSGHRDSSAASPDGAARLIAYAKSKNIGVSASAWDARNSALKGADGELTSFVGFKPSSAQGAGDGHGGPGKLLSNFYKTGEVSE